MLRLRGAIIQIFEWIIALSVAGILASGFCVFYSSGGVLHQNPSGSTDYKWGDSQFIGKMTEGIAFNKMDSNGFNNESIPDTIDILVMGASHMEALQIPTGKNMASILESVTGYHTYNIGISNHSFDICLDNFGNAVTEYSPSRYVVIHTNNLYLSDDRLESLLNGTRTRLSSAHPEIPEAIRANPLIQYGFQQMRHKFNIDMDQVKSKRDATVSETNVSRTVNSEMLDSVLDKVSETLNQSDVKLIVAYTPSIEIDSNGEIERTDDTSITEVMRREFELHNIYFVDCMDAFEEQYKRDYTLPYGFNNSRIGYGHLNETGHRILSEVIMDEIAEIEVSEK